MAIHRERRTLPFSPEQIFDLVADVERYPEFLPLWHAVATSRPVGNSDLYVTQQTLQLGPVQKTFRTETEMQRPGQIRVTSDDPLFDEFLIHWLLEPHQGHGCLVDFSLRCQAAPLFLRPIFEVVLGEAAQGIVRAFEQRARALYAVKDDSPSGR